MSITLNTSRVGNFTSSEIYKLMSMGKRPMTDEELAARPKSGTGSKTTLVDDGFGESALTYIDEKRTERKLGRSLNEDISARPLEWGKYIERRAFFQLGFDYDLTSKITLVHPTIDCWAGSPDGSNENTVIDIKCPYTIKSFCTFSDCSTIEQVREKHRDGEKFYWQLVSNAILTNKNHAELVCYLPFKSELAEIKNSIDEYEGDQNKIAWIHFAPDEDLPYLMDDGGYKNLHIIRFEVPQQDKKRLTHRVELAARLLKS